MKKSLLAAVAAFVTLVPVAQAQLSVSLKGTVERLPSAGCDPAATHRIRCTDVLLKSSVVDLAALEGRIVDITGGLSIGLACRTIDVQTAEAATSRTLQLAILGTRLGRTVTLTTFSPPGSIVAYVWSGGSGFLPLGPFGTYMLELQSSVFVTTSVSIGLDLRNERIPNDPNLVGVDIYYQFAYLSLVTGLEGGFLNPGCFQIQR